MNLSKIPAVLRINQMMVLRSKKRKILTKARVIAQMKHHQVIATMKRVTNRQAQLKIKKFLLLVQPKSQLSKLGALDSS